MVFTDEKDFTAEIAHNRQNDRVHGKNKKDFLLNDCVRKHHCHEESDGLCRCFLACKNADYLLLTLTPLTSMSLSFNVAGQPRIPVVELSSVWRMQHQIHKEGRMAAISPYCSPTDCCMWNLQS